MDTSASLFTVTFGSNHTAKHTHSLPLAWCWKTNKKKQTHSRLNCVFTLSECTYTNWTHSG